MQHVRAVMPARQALKSALQVGLAVVALGAVGLVVPRHYEMRPDIKTNFTLAIEWSLITVIMVSAPVVGQAARIGTERVLGTLMGGWLAYGLVSASDNDGFLTAMLFVVAIIGNLIGKRLDLAYGVGKLMLLTFTAVVFSSGDDNLLEVAVSRTCGIITGVLMFSFVATVVFQNTGSEQAFQDVAKMLQVLQKMHTEAWQAKYLMTLTGQKGQPSSGDALESISLSASTHQFMDSMYGMKTHLETASSEILLTHRWPLLGCHRVYLPFWDKLKRANKHSLPQAELQKLAHALFILARHLGALYATLDDPSTACCMQAKAFWCCSLRCDADDGLSQEAVLSLQQFYPPNVMLQVHNALQAFLAELHDSFQAFLEHGSIIAPNSSVLQDFMHATDCFKKISEARQQLPLSASPTDMTATSKTHSFQARACLGYYTEVRWCACQFAIWRLAKDAERSHVAMLQLQNKLSGTHNIASKGPSAV